MANEKTEKIERLAFQLFCQRSGVRDAAHVAVTCFRDAEKFAEIAEQHRCGALVTTKPDGPQLSYASLPNLPKTHPHNLVSQRFGNMEKVIKAWRWLEKYPKAETCEIDDCQINWDESNTKLARILLTEYIPDKERTAVAAN